HWIAFILLGIIGGKMLVESFGNENTEDAVYRINIRELTLLSVATSIDAMAVGIVFSAQNSDIVFSVSVIGIVTFLLSLVGVIIGNRFGSRYGKKAGIVGGVVLIMIGVKLFLEGIL
ncbi:MAG: manganese efflux pump MntP family protein, partial [Ruminococcus sp.]|nr:manganese efflux pump MntP family protein [Ruminococcus sp.]